MSKYYNQARVLMRKTSPIQGFKPGDSWLVKKFNILFMKFTFLSSSTLISFCNTTIWTCSKQYGHVK